MSGLPSHQNGNMFSWQGFSRLTNHSLSFIVLITFLMLCGRRESFAQDKEALINDALAAAPPEIAKTAKVVESDGKVLREGSGSYTCFPTMPELREKGKEPMCLDKTWLAWRSAWLHKKPFKPEHMGIGYMLAGDTGSSNIDPYAEAPTGSNQWVVEGPHVMVIVADAADLEAFSTDPSNGGAYVMWKGTPYAHIMVPTGAQPVAEQRTGTKK